MRTFIATAVLLTALSLDGSPLRADAAGDEEASRRLASLGWLAGHWRGPADEGEWEAAYTGADGGTILSANKQIVDGRVASIEFERFVVREGQVVMMPSPGGRPSEVHFTLTELDAEARRAVFTNPEHDFPQILTYHRVAPDRLRIDVEALRDGRRVGFHIELRPVAGKP
ncbi:MAG TPA: DUF6265 family protein [Candidatus Polarisedimenticolaceae bacterium]|nr:DUF6265 family protein [Candidatus Polarisedimenticolaceae bacterium]